MSEVMERPEAVTSDTTRKWSFDPVACDAAYRDALDCAYRVVNGEISLAGLKRELVLKVYRLWCLMVSEEEEAPLRRALAELADNAEIRLPETAMRFLLEKGFDLPHGNSRNVIGGFFKTFYDRAIALRAVGEEATEASKAAASMDRSRYGDLLLMAIDRRDESIISGGKGIAKLREEHGEWQKTHLTLARIRDETAKEKTDRETKEKAEAEQEKQTASVMAASDPFAGEAQPAGLDPFGEPTSAEPSETSGEEVDAGQTTEQSDTPEATPEATGEAKASQTSEQPAQPSEATPEATGEAEATQSSEQPAEGQQPSKAAQDALRQALHLPEGGSEFFDMPSTPAQPATIAPPTRKASEPLPAVDWVSFERSFDKPKQEIVIRQAPRAAFKTSGVEAGWKGFVMLRMGDDGLLYVDGLCEHDYA